MLSESVESLVGWRVEHYVPWVARTVVQWEFVKVSCLSPVHLVWRCWSIVFRQFCLVWYIFCECLASVSFLQQHLSSGFVEEGDASVTFVDGDFQFCCLDDKVLWVFLHIGFVFSFTVDHHEAFTLCRDGIVGSGLNTNDVVAYDSESHGFHLVLTCLRNLKTDFSSVTHVAGSVGAYGSADCCGKQGRRKDYSKFLFHIIIF